MWTLLLFGVYKRFYSSYLYLSLNPGGFLEENGGDSEMKPHREFLFFTFFGGTSGKIHLMDVLHWKKIIFGDWHYHQI